MGSAEAPARRRLVAASAAGGASIAALFLMADVPASILAGGALVGAAVGAGLARVRRGLGTGPIAAWLTLVAGGAVIAGALVRGEHGEGLARGGLTALTQGLSLALGAAFAVASLRRRERPALAAATAAIDVASAAWLVGQVVAHAAPLTGVRALAVGAAHVCALVDGGDVLCWGGNYEGQLGDGTTAPRFHPARVSGVERAEQIATNGLTTCAVVASGDVLCWGGGGTLVRARVPELPPVRRVALGSTLACVLSRGGEVLCRRLPEGRPVIVAQAPGASDLTVTSWGGCAHGGGKLVCWDQPDDEDAPFAPRAEVCVPPLTGEPAARGRLCDLDERDHLRCFRRPPRCHESIEIPGAEHVTQVVTAEGRNCGVDPQGHVRCWDAYGRGGDVVLSGVAQLDAGGDAMCAALADGTARCWGGRNTFGEIGDGTRRSQRVPSIVRR
jgi:hypothetical protein